MASTYNLVQIKRENLNLSCLKCGKYIPLTSPLQRLTDTLESASSRTDPVNQQSWYFSTVELVVVAEISLGFNIRVISVWAPLM